MNRLPDTDKEGVTELAVALELVGLMEGKLKAQIREMGTGEAAKVVAETYVEIWKIVTNRKAENIPT